MSTIDFFPSSLGLPINLQHVVNNWMQQGLVSWATLSAMVGGAVLYGLLLALYRSENLSALCVYSAWLTRRSFLSDPVTLGKYSGTNACR
jgi:hypothetical protein